MSFLVYPPNNDPLFPLVPGYLTNTMKEKTLKRIKIFFLSQALRIHPKGKNKPPWSRYLKTVEHSNKFT
jgi:hypothetical protein